MIGMPTPYVRPSASKRLMCTGLPEPFLGPVGVGDAEGLALPVGFSDACFVPPPEQPDSATSTDSRIRTAARLARRAGSTSDPPPHLSGHPGSQPGIFKSQRLAVVESFRAEAVPERVRVAATEQTVQCQ